MKKADLANLLAVATLSLMLAVWSFATAPFQGENSQEAWHLDPGLVFGQELELEEFAAFQYQGRDTVLLWPGSQITATWDESVGQLTVDLKKGSLLYATEAGDFSVQVKTSFATVESEQSTGYVALNSNADQLDVYAIQHPSNVELRQEEVILGRLPVANNSRIKIHKMKVTSALADLDPLGLHTVFPALPLSEKELTGALATQLERMDTIYAENALAILTAFQGETRLGPDENGLGMQVYSGVKALKSSFTVFPHAQKRLDASYENRLLTFASTNLLYGSRERGEFWMQEWSRLQHDPEALNKLYADLFFVIPGDDLYPLKKSLLSARSEGDLQELQRQYRELEDLARAGEENELQNAYDAYQGQLEILLTTEVFVGEEGLQELSDQAFLLNNLLAQTPELVSSENFQIVPELETQLLALTQGSAQLDDNRQNFVQGRFDFLDSLFALVLRRQVPVEEASTLASDLLFSAEAYLSSISTEPGLRIALESEMERYEVAVQFMNSAEFFTYESFEEGLVAYEKKLEDLNDLNEYIQNTRAGSVEESSVAPDLEDAILEVGKALTASGVQYTEILSLKDSENRLFEIKGARTGGYFFDAHYDRETQIFYDVVVGEVRFSSGVLASEIRKVILGVMQAPEDQQTEEVAPVDEPSSLAESVAIDFAHSRFREAGLDPKDFVFTIIDLKKNLFQFDGVVSDGQITLRGMLDAKAGTLEDVQWGAEDATQSLPDMSLVDLLKTLEGLLVDGE